MRQDVSSLLLPQSAIRDHIPLKLWSQLGTFFLQVALVKVFYHTGNKDRNTGAWCLLWQAWHCCLLAENGRLWEFGPGKLRNEQDLIAHPSRSLKDHSDERKMDCGSPGQEALEGKHIRTELETFLVIFWQSVAAFCPCPENFLESTLKGNVLRRLQEFLLLTVV